jgi:hypothetical protein
MLLCASLLLAVTADGFSRFSGEGPFEIPNIEAGLRTFRVVGDGSEALRFAPDSVRGGIESRSKTEVVFRLRSGPGIPIRVKYSLLFDGLEFECVNGLSLRGKGSAPFITWHEGSVGSGVPAPPSEWYLLSWTEQRAPLLICFPDERTPLVTLESDGEFFVTTETGITGRVFIRLPLGNKAFATHRAADLGSLLKTVEPSLKYLNRPAPKLIDEQIQSNSDSVSVRWRFDKKGAIVPAPLALGQLRGVRVTGNTKLFRDGLHVLDGTELTVNFRMNRLLPGMAVLQGGPSTTSAHPRFGLDRPEGIVDTALQWLSGTIDPNLVRRANRLLDEYDDNGSNASLNAALALLSNAMPATGRRKLQLTANVDWHTWRDSQFDLATQSVLSTVLAFSDTKTDRLNAAMIACSLSQERNVPLASLRAQLFPEFGASLAPWFMAFTSPVRLLSSADVKATGDGLSILLEGVAQTGAGVSAVLYSEQPLRVASASNVSGAKISQNGNVWTIVGSAVSSGTWRIRLSRPAGSRPLPTAVQGPSYSGALR